MSAPVKRYQHIGSLVTSNEAMRNLYPMATQYVLAADYDALALREAKANDLLALCQEHLHPHADAVLWGKVVDHLTAGAGKATTILRPISGPTGTGPIDNLVMHETQLACPQCGASQAWHIPEQAGTCHGGEFSNSCIDYHWCEACEASFTDK